MPRDAATAWPVRGCLVSRRPVGVHGAGQGPALNFWGISQRQLEEDPGKMEEWVLCRTVAHPRESNRRGRTAMRICTFLRAVMVGCQQQSVRLLRICTSA